jgi:ubiquinone/menaquinone biosynthesis C-methylase UbiE/uncharacterized protein YbaR (Trm112 family)
MRFADTLRCPCCKGWLTLDAFDRRKAELPAATLELARRNDVLDERFDQWIEAGVLTCTPCSAMFPIIDGLPILLCYSTPMHAEFMRRHAANGLARHGAFQFLEHAPADGERAVMNSFSREWLDYDYDGVIWEMNYEDHERRFLREMGDALIDGTPRNFLEVGCGLGITTFLAHKNAGVDAVGLDLSLAVWKASRHYRDNPFLHFVEASVFALPFGERSFDLIYSRGVLHHTVSTERAFRHVAPLCRPGGTVYLWVYGTGSIRETMFRRAVYALEKSVRPVLSEAPTSPPAKAFLAAMGLGYVVFNRTRRTFNPEIQPLNLSRGVHAARDRFTPKYAHRHEASEVADWFRRAGFDSPQVIDWRIMPAADHDDYRRNIGVRARLASR